MEFAGVYHKTSEQMSYALDENQLVVNIKTGYDVRKFLFIMAIPSMQEFWEEMRSGQEKGKRLYTKNVCPIKSGGQQHFCLFISDANIILNFIQKKKSGITLKMVF